MLLAATLGCGFGAGADATTNSAATNASSVKTTPSAVNFGTVAVGATSAKTVTVSNSGSSSVTITSGVLTGPGFTLAGLSLPLTLAAGQSTSFQVSFAPGNTGTATGNVTLTSSEQDADYVVSLAATSTQPSSSASPTYSAELSWNASASLVAGYHVYRAPQSNGQFSRITSTPVAQNSFSDGNLAGQNTFVYAVTAVDAGGQESQQSNQAVAVVP
jgi:hypothetical protein